jgi:hypothetical protein
MMPARFSISRHAGRLKVLVPHFIMVQTRESWNLRLLPEKNVLKSSVALFVGLLLAEYALAEGTAAAPPNAATLTISPARPLSVKESRLRQQVFKLCQEMLHAPAGKFGAHPSAAIFPGVVDPRSRRGTRTITLRHVPPTAEMLRLIAPLEFSSPLEPTLYSTGLYAAPGEIVVVDVPPELQGKISVQIGCHTDNLNEWVAAHESWRRMPLLVNQRKLEHARTEISNPFGGLVFITCPPTTAAWQGAVTISHAVAAPRFELGRTTATEWQQMLATSGAPWGEMGSDNVIVMLPTPVLKKVTDPDARMKIWDKIIGAEMDLAQLPLPFYRAQRLLTDVHIGGGFMHSGYPIMVHHCPEVGLVTEDFLSDPAKFATPANGGPNWGFFHEIGHNMQNIDWVFDGTTEVSVNLFSLYCFDKVCGGRDAAHPGVSNDATRKMMSEFFSRPADFRRWQRDPFLGLLTFRLIQNDFGWELFKQTFRRYHVLADAQRPKNDQQKRDLLVRYLSESGQRDFGPYFSAWGIPLSPQLRDELKKYPAWFPCNFPAAASAATWNARKVGNHRALVRVPFAADAVWVRIPWRRRDAEPEKKAVIVVEESSGQTVANVLPVQIRDDCGDIVFEAKNAGDYGVYYLPYQLQGKYYARATYQTPQNTAAPAWLKRNGLEQDAGPRLASGVVPRASLVALQSVDEFNAYTTMEQAASIEETARFLLTHRDKPFLIFPEDRANPIRMTDRLPWKWVQDGPRTTFTGEAARGEFYVFQLGLYAAAADLSHVTVTFSDLATDAGRNIPASALRCFNTGGINWDGAAFAKTVSVARGAVQPLWCGVQVPQDAMGTYRGTVRVKAADLAEQSLQLDIKVARKRLADGGDNEPWRHSRLRWLDSTLAVDDDVIHPFTPIRGDHATLEILGRRMTLAPSGLPAELTSFFSPEVTDIAETPQPLLAAPFQLAVEDPTGNRLAWKAGNAPSIQRKDGIATWEATSMAGLLTMNVHGALEPDGFAKFNVTLAANAGVDVRDVRLEIPLIEKAVPYMMGLGRQGGYRPAKFDWRWGQEKNQDSFWLGNPSAGLQVKLKGDNYIRPLLTNFYRDQPLNMPPAWFNGGRGGVRIEPVNEGTVRVVCFAGPRALKAGEQLHFDFEMLATPFRPIDPQAQWRTRYFHACKPVDEVLQRGANTINIHHGNALNPYINYPFLRTAELKRYVDEAHAKGLMVKIYYTIRELSNHAAELFALRSLGDEIFPPGPGRGSPWLQEHLGGNYIPAWCVPQWQDAAIIDKGPSRWANYYVEGLAWLVKNVGIDGLYLDDLAFDRSTMKRIRKVLDRGRPGSLIDFHSANLYNPKDGFASCANIYLEHLPYIDRLWFGEYFDYNAPPDFWLVEISGIPFGVMGEMLQDGGNKWRGMIYGMTNRVPCRGNDPSPIWKAWDDFGIRDSRMIGYWSPRCPVTTGRPDVLATAYVGKGRTMIALASWAATDTKVRLHFDWPVLGIDPATARLTASTIRDFQPAAVFDPATSLPVPKGKGWLLVLGGDGPK